MQSICAAVALLGVAACGEGDSQDAGDGNNEASSGDSSSGAAASTDAGPDTSATADASTSGADGSGSGSTDGASESDSGGAVDDRLLPLEDGRVWTYDVAVFGGFPVCSGGTHDEVVLGEVQQGGRDAFEVQSFCPAAGTATVSVDGDVVDTWFNGGWIRGLDVPVEEGHMWSSTGAVQYVWRDEGTVTVAAGTFEACWRREQIVSYEAYTIYCRGVGAVRHFSQDLAGAGWDAQLASTSF